MCSPVEDVHHRDGQRLRVRSADVPIERHFERSRGGPCVCKRNGEDGVRAESRFGRSTVKSEHRLIDERLIKSVQSLDLRVDLLVHVLDRLLDALAEIAELVAVAKFDGFIFAGRCTARNSRTARNSVLKDYFRLDRRVAARIEYLAGPHVFYIAHPMTPLFKKL